MAPRAKPEVSVVIDPPSLDPSLDQPFDEDLLLRTVNSIVTEEDSIQYSDGDWIDGVENKDNVASGNKENQSANGSKSPVDDGTDEEAVIFASIDAEASELLNLFIAKHPFVCKPADEQTWSARRDFLADVRREAAAAGMDAARINHLVRYVEGLCEIANSFENEVSDDELEGFVLDEVRNESGKVQGTKKRRRTSSLTPEKPRKARKKNVDLATTATDSAACVVEKTYDAAVPREADQESDIGSVDFNELRQSLAPKAVALADETMVSPEPEDYELNDESAVDISLDSPMVAESPSPDHAAHDRVTTNHPTESIPPNAQLVEGGNVGSRSGEESNSIQRDGAVGSARNKQNSKPRKPTPRHNSADATLPFANYDTFFFDGQPTEVDPAKLEWREKKKLMKKEKNHRKRMARKQRKAEQRRAQLALASAKSLEPAVSQELPEQTSQAMESPSAEPSRDDAEQAVQAPADEMSDDNDEQAAPLDSTRGTSPADEDPAEKMLSNDIDQAGDEIPRGDVENVEEDVVAKNDIGLSENDISLLEDPTLWDSDF